MARVARGAKRKTCKPGSLILAEEKLKRLEECVIFK